MTRTRIKKTTLCLALTLFALPAMADNIFSGIVTFGREILDETRKLAPGIQNDRRNEAPADVRAALNDGRDRPAQEANDNNHQNSNTQSGSNNSNIELAPPVNGQPTGANLNYTYGDSQRSNTSQRNNSGASSSSNNNTDQNLNDGYRQNDSHNSNDSRGSNDNYGSSDSRDNNTGSNDNYGSDPNNNQEAQQQAPQSNFGWQEENNL